MKIKHKITRAVLFDGADLTGADLRHADLTDADLRHADLHGAELRGASLDGADLRYADLTDADLTGAKLDGAKLDGANLGGAKLYGAKLVGTRPFISIGPIGSRLDYLQAFITDQGVAIQTGCFFDTRDQFAAAMEKTHNENNHGIEYRAALSLIDAHAELWGST